MLASSGELYPTHHPQMADLSFLTPIQKLFYIWSILLLNATKEMTLFSIALERLVDAPPVIPKVREILTLKYATISLEAQSWTVVVKLIKTQRSARQVQLQLCWKSKRAPEEGNSILISMGQATYFPFDPLLGQERDLLRKVKATI